MLEITVTVTDQGKPGDRLIVPIASTDAPVFANDLIEWDLAVSPDTPAGGFFYSPFKGDDKKPGAVGFYQVKTVDQFGRRQMDGPAPKGGPGVWEHRAIGMCSFVPRFMPRHGMVFNGRKPGSYRVFLSNLRIRCADGSIVPIWASKADTRAGKIDDAPGFKDVKVRAGYGSG